MVEYDPKLIQDYASSLYNQAKSTVTLHFFIGITLGLIIAMFISDQLMGAMDFLIMSLGVMVGGVLGYGAGRSRAFELKLHAQSVLCQVQIEENTQKKY